MKHARSLAFVGALLVFLAGAPTAASHATAASAAPIGAGAPTRSEESPDRHAAPRLGAVPGIHRAVVTTAATPRRFGEGGGKLRALVPNHARIVARARAARIDADASARLLRSSNTPCCVRGPPAAV